jgi:hypothetical protein
LVCFLAFSVDSMAGSSFFDLSTESKTIFMLSRAWSTASLLNESEVDCSLVEGNKSRDKACDSTNVGISIPVGLASLAMRVEGLFDGREQ